MLKTATLIYPHQLYRPHPAIHKKRLQVLIEDPLFFGDPVYKIRFHKQKLMLHRASMKHYEREVLRRNGFPCEYIEYADMDSSERVFEKLKDLGIETIHVVDPTDSMLERRIRRCCVAFGMDLMIYETPNFLIPKAAVERAFEKKRRYVMTDFYIEQRKRMGMLVDEKGRPVGSKWIFSESEKQASPRSIKVPGVKRFRLNRYVDEARRYVELNFTSNPGLTDRFIYPICEEEAKEWLHDFLERRLHGYGRYGWAIMEGEPFGFHPVMSAVLNVGLLSPRYVLERVHAYLKHHRMPVSSVELLVRNIIGRREFVRAVYLCEGSSQCAINFFFHSRKPSAMWYVPTSEIGPLNDVLNKVLQFGYCSQAERLMVVGNLMLLCEIDPDKVYRWFMEMFVDAYDWVNVTNVYGISQFADGGLASARPIFCLSKDLLRMSTYKGGSWGHVWDALVWRFVDKHKILFSKNKKLVEYTQRLEGMSKDQRKEYFRTAQEFMKMATR